MNKRNFYIGTAIAILIIGIALSFTVGQYYDSPEAVVLHLERAHHPKIINTAWSGKGNPIVFFSSDKHGVYAMVFKKTTIGKKCGWAFRRGTYYTLTDIIANNRRADTPLGTVAWRKLEDGDCIYWGVSMDRSIYNYTINLKEPITQIVTIDNREFILWYIFENHSSRKEPITRPKP